MLRSMISAGQTTDWVGRTVAALLTDKKIAKKAGRVIWCNDVSINVFIFLITNSIFRLLMNSAFWKMMDRLYTPIEVYTVYSNWRANLLLQSTPLFVSGYQLSYTNGYFGEKETNSKCSYM